MYVHTIEPSYNKIANLIMSSTAGIHTAGTEI